MFDILAMKKIIYECVLNENETNLLKNQMVCDNDPVEYLADNIRADFMSFISFISNDGSLCSDPEAFIDYLSILRELCDLFSTSLSKWPKTEHEFKRNVDCNTRLIEEMFRSAQHLSIQSASTIMKERFCNEKYKLSMAFIRLASGLQINTKLLVFDILKCNKIDGNCGWNFYDRCMRAAFLDALTSLQVPFLHISFELEVPHEF